MKVTRISLSATDEGRSVPFMATVARNRFYAAFALALAVFVFVAFARTYYLRHWFEVPPINVMLHIHSIVFTAWVVLFVIQTRLIAAQNYRTHMQLGIAGVVMAALVVIFGYATAIASASAPRMRPMGMNSQQFVLVPLVAITSFAILVAAASGAAQARGPSQAPDDARDDRGVRVRPLPASFS
jgi:hypothetical protein